MLKTEFWYRSPSQFFGHFPKNLHYGYWPTFFPKYNFLKIRIYCGQQQCKYAGIFKWNPWNFSGLRNKLNPFLPIRPHAKKISKPHNFFFASTIFFKFVHIVASNNASMLVYSNKISTFCLAWKISLTPIRHRPPCKLWRRLAAAFMKQLGWKYTEC